MAKIIEMWESEDGETHATEKEAVRHDAKQEFARNCRSVPDGMDGKDFGTRVGLAEWLVAHKVEVTQLYDNLPGGR